MTKFGQGVQVKAHYPSERKRERNSEKMKKEARRKYWGRIVKGIDIPGYYDKKKGMGKGRDEMFSPGFYPGIMLRFAVYVLALLNSHANHY